MKWFKHFSKAREDRFVEKLISEFGVAGYGLYFYCIEVIVGSVDSENITFELEPDAELLARRLGMDTVLVEKIMHRCVEYGLFELNDLGRLTCFKIAKYLEKSITRNPEMVKIIDQSRALVPDNPGQSRTIPECPDQIRLDQIRLDKNKDKKRTASPPRATFKKPSLEEIKQFFDDSKYKQDPENFFNYWESVGWKLANGRSIVDWKATARNYVKKPWAPLAPPKPRKKEYCKKCGKELFDGGCRNLECPECPLYEEK